jgi:hypothetical protein
MAIVTDIDFLRECFEVDLTAGVLAWKTRPRHHFPSLRAWQINCSTFAGRRAGCASSNKYVRVRVSGRLLLAHRIIFALAFGRWPTADIDHINGDPGDNRLANLREASRSENLRNQKRRRDNTSKIVGVSKSPNGHGWRARIWVDGRERHIGIFLSKAAAAAARKAAEMRHGFHPNHGRAV